MFNRSFLCASAFALGILVSNVTLADSSNGYVCASDVNQVIQNQCCSKRTRRKSKQCLNDYVTKITKVRGLVGTQYAKAVKQFIKRSRIFPLNKCKTVDVNLNDANDMCISYDEIVEKVSNACCDKKYKQDRLSCLNSKTTNIKKLKDAIGEETVELYSQLINRLKESTNCGAGGEERTTLCQNMRGTGNGFLWKGKGEAYGGVPVAILPIFNKATSCVVEGENGNGATSMWCSSQSANPWNGVGRQHWRGRVKCGSMKKPSILRCKIGGKWNCWKINNPCQGRIE